MKKNLLISLFMSSLVCYCIVQPKADTSAHRYFSGDILVVEDDSTSIAEVNAGEDSVYYVVDEMPKFQGKGSDNFGRYLVQNLTVPDSAFHDGICSKFYFSFIIDKEGRLTQAEMLRSCDPVVSAEIIRILETSPPWTPGRLHGKLVNVKFTFPLILEFY